MSMCPHCHKELKIPDRAYSNAKNYDKTVRVTTECCQHLVTVTPVTLFNVHKMTPKKEKYVKDTEDDDWGVKFKLQPNVPPAARVDEIPRFVSCKYKVKGNDA